MSESSDFHHTIVTVGHSNHDPQTFVELLRRAGIATLVDVRSQPYSGFAPHFSRSPLKSSMESAGIAYVHDTALGGRPDDPEMYDAQGHVLYGSVAESPDFLEAIERLEGLARDSQVAIMCGEENPAECHRRILVGKVLDERGWKVRHLRRSGELQSEADQPMIHVQEGLFEGGEFSTWRSIRSVSPRSRPPSSSEF